MTPRMLGHARLGAKDDTMSGALELLGGWERGRIRDIDATSPLWRPGSKRSVSSLWRVCLEGSWERQP